MLPSRSTVDYRLSKRISTLSRYSQTVDSLLQAMELHVILPNALGNERGSMLCLPSASINQVSIACFAGMLTALTAVFRELGIDVVKADVDGDAESINDTFYVTQVWDALLNGMQQQYAIIWSCATALS